MKKAEILEILQEIAILLELKGENPFRIRSYQTAIRVLETIEDFDQRVIEGSLEEMSGIGGALAEKITTLYETDTLEFHKKLLDSVPKGLLEMLQIPSLGGKKIKSLHDSLGIETIEELRTACSAGKVANIKGFGPKMQEKILLGISNREAYNARHLWWKARETVIPILNELRNLKWGDMAEVAGSFRRKMETVGDIDLLAASKNAQPIMDWFVSLPNVEEVTAKGETKSSVRLAGGMQTDLRVVPPKQFFFSLHHFTGSKDHNVKIRQRALGLGFSLSEWGLRHTDEEKARDGEKTLRAESEEDIFAALGLFCIPPELREGLNEIEIAETGECSNLIDMVDLRGVFHNHTTASDGRDSLLEMAVGAEARGWEYLGIADHSKASFQANGLDEKRLLAQVEEIAALNDSKDIDIHLFAGIEVDILGNGELDLPDSILGELDYVVASVHSRFSQSEEEMTSRIIRAIEHPLVTMVGHLSGRLLLRREAYKINIAKVVDAAAANNKIIEINANPQRMDMDWRHWRQAADKGVLACINPDAHAVEHYDFVEAGINVARKGLLRNEEIFNTKPIAQVKKKLEAMRA